MGKTFLDMYKHDDNIIRFQGQVTYNTTEEKKVVIDGETYVNKKNVQKTLTIEDMRKDEWINLHFGIFEYHIPGYGNIAKIEYNSVFYRDLADMCKPPKYCSGSTNSYVNNILVADSYGLIDSVVKRVYTGKNEYKREDVIWDEIMRSLEVEICINDYGWNNGLFVTVSLEDFLKFNHKEVDPYLVDLFRKKGVSLKSKNELNKAESLILNKINYETSKQQKFSSLSF